MAFNLLPKNYETGKYWTHGVMLIEGCTKVSPGCANCWSEGWAKRYDVPFDKVTFRADRLERLGVNGKPKVFSLWNDLFHDEVTEEEVDRTLSWCVMKPEHQYMILTKRAERVRWYFDGLAELQVDSARDQRLYDAWRAIYGDELNDRPGIDNLWLGVTAENQEMAEARIPDLLKTKAARRFVSIEPILGPVDLTKLRTGPDKPMAQFPGATWHPTGNALAKPPETKPGETVLIPPAWTGVDWVIVGCETGPGARIDARVQVWIASVIIQCKEAGVPCWVKAYPVDRDSGKWVASKNMNDWPEPMRVREVPA